jgi:hypothetical protein
VLQKSADLLNYLGHCCEVTDNALRRLNQDETSEHELLAVWNYTPGTADFVLLDALQSDFGIRWLESQDVKIEKFDNGNAIKILSGNNFLFITLDEKKNNAIMDTSDKTYEFNVLDSQHDGPILVYNKKNALERAIEEISDRIRSLITLLVFSIISGRCLSEDEVKILTDDRKFMSLLEHTKEEFLDHYRALNVKTINELAK